MDSFHTTNYVEGFDIKASLSNKTSKSAKKLELARWLHPSYVRPLFEAHIMIVVCSFLANSAILAPELSGFKSHAFETSGFFDTVICMIHQYACS